MKYSSTVKRYRFELFREQDGRCYYCNVYLDGITDSHLEHKIARSNGGKNEKENLVISCQTCNISKNNKSLEEWFELNKRMAVELQRLLQWRTRIIYNLIKKEGFYEEGIDIINNYYYWKLKSDIDNA
jgi:hypothetical protein